jgi:hypothetical protein
MLPEQFYHPDMDPGNRTGPEVYHKPAGLLMIQGTL